MKTMHAHSKAGCLLLRLASILLAVSLLFMSPAPVLGAGTPRLQVGNYHWADTPRDIFIYCSTSDFTRSEREAIRDALSEWNAIRSYSGRLMVSAYLTTNDDSYEVEGRFTFENHRTDYVAHTLHEESDNGEIQSVTIILNSYYDFSVGGSSTTFDLQTIVQHEMGHVLGVAHCHEEGQPEPCWSATCLDNVMNRRMEPNEVRTEMQPYDIGSYKSIYS